MHKCHPGIARKHWCVQHIVGGVLTRKMTLTSAFSWYYGNYPFNNRPQSGKAHHFYNEARVNFKQQFAKGRCDSVCMNVYVCLHVYVYVCL